MARTQGVTGVALLAAVLASSNGWAQETLAPKLVFPVVGEMPTIRNPGLVISLDWHVNEKELADGSFELRNDDDELLEVGLLRVSLSTDGERAVVTTAPLELAASSHYTLSSNLEYSIEEEDIRVLDEPRVVAEFTTGETFDEEPPALVAVEASDTAEPTFGWYGPPCDLSIEVEVEDNATPATVGFRLKPSHSSEDDPPLTYPVDGTLIVQIPGGQAAKTNGLTLIPVDSSGNEGESKKVNTPECPFQDNREGPIDLGDDVVDSDGGATVDPASGCSISGLAVHRGSSAHWFWTASLSLGALGWVARRRNSRR